MNKQAFYQTLAEQAKSLTEGEPNVIANMANLSALLFMSLEDINWAGFYLVDNPEQLILGPFQGNPACIRIPVGKGVCGTAALLKETQLVSDVHAFEGHIACDTASNSEIVVPIIKNGKIFAVLDIDSPSLSRFDEQDKVGLETLIRQFETQV
ncbi:GAF domain-containing protein [Pseudoalteromonas sp. NBT06-2]|uniref:GAF domain-containing protein n=1 Tax=Pseudoalteromonas sp. NBT06-2 TaxID=2025950 RepID=UPI000BA58E0E|nr:GAF domain-containing protein [Pseudoalteromonas sp. NBT06-2]PAJ75364.1 GAF domain-containing protein [Pseudoalteromonas sp. NBT06-2]